MNVYLNNQTVFKRHGLIQYEYNQILNIYGLKIDNSNLIIEFHSINDDAICYKQLLQKENDYYTAKIPNELLHIGDNIIAYILLETETITDILVKLVLFVEKKQDSNEVAPPDDDNNDELLIGSLISKIEILENKIIEEYATTNYVDQKIENINIETAEGYATEEYVDQKIEKINNELEIVQNNIPDISNFTTKEYVDNEILKVNGVEYIQLSKLPGRPFENKEKAFYLISNKETGINLFDEYIWFNDCWELFGTTSVDFTDYATKTYVDEHISNAETNYAAKSDVYTKNEIDNMIGKISTLLATI